MPALKKPWRLPWHLFVEKIPLFLLALADSALTVRTQVDAIQSLETVSWLSRIANALVAYVSYLGCFFWPQGLAILYPHTINGVSTGKALERFVVLAVVSAGTFACRRRAPYLLVGWLWYLGMLVPVIGLLQVGGQSMADRYTYLPQIGLVLGLVWALTDWKDSLAARGGTMVRQAGRFLGALAAVGVIAALAIGAWRQTGYWRDSETLWVRDIMMYPNLVGHYNLGLALAADHRHAEAIEQFEKACEITPTDEDTLYSYAQSLEALGRDEEAVTKYRATLAVNKKSVSANDRLAGVLLRQGKDREALACWRQALEEDPKNVTICHQIAGLLAASPDASVRDGKEAVLVAQRMLKLAGGKDPAAFDAMAAAHAETGNFRAALQDAQTALELATANGDQELANEIQAHLSCYQAGKPYRRTQMDMKNSVGPVHQRPSPVQK